jgi:hypothetical protein
LKYVAKKLLKSSKYPGKNITLTLAMIMMKTNKPYEIETL